MASRSLSMVSAISPRAIAPTPDVWTLRERPKRPMAVWAAGRVALAPAAMSALIEAQAQAEPIAPDLDRTLSTQTIDRPRIELDGADRRKTAQVIAFPDRRRRNALSRARVDLRV